LNEDSVDPVLKIGKLRDAYLNRYRDYLRGITVPAMVEVASKSVVSNDFFSIVEDLATQWTDYQRPGAPDLYPEALRAEIDEINDRVFRTVNNGVYRAGFTGSQEVYEKAFNELFATLDWLEERLSTRRYLVGDHITLADVYLYPTLVRFDMVYHNHFKCNRNKISEMPNLWGYLRDLFQTPGFGDSTNFQQIKDHYFLVHTDINPTGVVPVGPSPESFYTEHGREGLPGTPFDKSTAPGAPQGEDVLDGDEAGAFAYPGAPLVTLRADLLGDVLQPRGDLRARGGTGGCRGNQLHPSAQLGDRRLVQKVREGLLALSAEGFNEDDVRSKRGDALRVCWRRTP